MHCVNCALWTWNLPPRILSNIEIQSCGDGRTFIFNPTTSFGCVAMLGTTKLSNNTVHYFAVEFYPPYFGEARAVGIGSSQALLHFKRRTDRHGGFYINQYQSLIGLDENSWGLNYDGFLMYRKSKKQVFKTPQFSLDEPLKIVATYDGYSRVLMYHVNDQDLGVAFENIDKPVYPMVCSSGRETCVKLLWNKSCIGSLQSMCRGVIREHVHDNDRDNLPLPPHLIAFINYNQV